MPLIRWISLGTSPTNQYKIETNPGLVSDSTTGFLITGMAGVLEPGEADDSPVSRSFSDGYVLNPYGTLTGKTLSFSVKITGRTPTETKQLFDGFIRYILNNRILIVSTDFLGPWRAKYQGMELVSGGDGSGSSFIVDVTYATAEAY